MTFIAMRLFSMPYALLISVIVGITQMVPIIGPWCSGAVGALIILVTDPPMTVWFIIALLVVQQLEANLVYPRAHIRMGEPPRGAEALCARHAG